MHIEVNESWENNPSVGICVTLGPGSPGVPGGPIGPVGPDAPFSPGGPTSPGDPCLPSCPGRPSAPGGPGGPGGPGSPGSPCYVPRVLRRYRFLPARALDKSVSRYSSACATVGEGTGKEHRRKMSGGEYTKRQTVEEEERERERERERRRRQIEKKDKREEQDRGQRDREKERERERERDRKRVEKTVRVLYRIPLIYIFEFMLGSYKI